MKTFRIGKNEIDEFTAHYLIAALWTESDDDEIPLENNYELDSFADCALQKAKEDCGSFVKENAENLAQAGSDEQNGHDFWLTRNGHGTGFWDRDYGKLGDKLTEACCSKFKEIYLYVGDDGKLYFD